MIGVFSLNSEFAARVAGVVSKIHKSGVIPVAEFTPALLAPYSIIIKVPSCHSDCDLSEILAFGELDDYETAATTAGDIVKCITIKHNSDRVMTHMRVKMALFDVTAAQNKLHIRIASAITARNHDDLIKCAGILGQQAKSGRAPTRARVIAAISGALAPLDGITHLYTRHVIMKKLGELFVMSIGLLPNDKLRVIKCAAGVINHDKAKIHDMFHNYNTYGLDLSFPPLDLAAAVGMYANELCILKDMCAANGVVFKDIFSLIDLIKLTSLRDYCRLALFDTNNLITRAADGDLDDVLVDAGVLRCSFIKKLSDAGVIDAAARLEIITSLI